jgi:hypothetical protein
MNPILNCKWKENKDLVERQSSSNLINLIPVIQTTKKERLKEGGKKCVLKNCSFCSTCISPYLQNASKPGWRESAIAAFKGILDSDVSKLWLSLTDDIYPLFETHWEILCPARKERDDAWRKHLQDALSHNKKYFVSGKDVFGQTGYWRLRLPHEEIDNIETPAYLQRQRSMKRLSPEKSKKEEISSKRLHISSREQVENLFTAQQMNQSESYSNIGKIMNFTEEESEMTKTISDYPYHSPLSKEFGWHFSNFLTRAKIISTGSVSYPPVELQCRN